MIIEAAVKPIAAKIAELRKQKLSDVDIKDAIWRDDYEWLKQAMSASTNESFAADYNDTFDAALKLADESKKHRSYLIYAGIGLAGIAGWWLYRRSQGKSFFGLEDDGLPSRLYRERNQISSLPSRLYRERNQISGVSRTSHQARFGAAARSCGGRGFNRKQFASCMKSNLHG